MSMNIKTIQHDEYLEFVVTGSHDLNEAINKFSYILDCCRRTGLKKVLVDYRKLLYPTDDFEKARYASRVKDQYQKYLESGGHELQLAYLSPIIMSYEPGAEIGKKIVSMQFELFGDLNEALEWLGVKTT